MRKLSKKRSREIKCRILLLLSLYTLLQVTHCSDKNKDDTENQPVLYHFSKKTGDINLEDIQQFDEVNKIIDEDIDLRVKEATEKMMKMTIEDNVDHIDDDIQNFDMSTMPKDFGPTMTKKRGYKLPKSKRSLVDEFKHKKKKFRTDKIFSDSRIGENRKRTKLSEKFKGRPVQVLSLQKGKAVFSKPVMDGKLLRKMMQAQEDGPVMGNNERELRQIHKHSYYKVKKHKKRRKRRKMKNRGRNRRKRSRQRRKMKSSNRKRKKRRVHKRKMKKSRSKRRRKNRKLKMHIKILRTQVKKHKKRHKHYRKRQLMLPGMPGGGGGGVVVAPNQGAGIANAQVVVNSLGTPATIPYAEGNAVPAYAPEDTAPKVIVTRMKMPSNLPY